MSLPSGESPETIAELRSELETLKNSQAELAQAFSGLQIKAQIAELPTPPQISSTFLASLLPTVSLKKMESVPPFGVAGFTGARYDVYGASDIALKVWVFAGAFPIIYNLFLAVPEFTANEQATFYDRTVYLNAKKDDLKVRFLIYVDGQTIGIEIPKNLYPKIKSLLTR